MANAYARLVPRMEKLRAQHPELEGRLFPQMARTSRHQALAEFFERISCRIEQLRLEHLPVRIVLDVSASGDRAWLVEDAKAPHLIR